MGGSPAAPSPVGNFTGKDANVIAQRSLFSKILSIVFSIFVWLWTLFWSLISIVVFFTSENLSDNYEALIVFVVLAGIGVLLLLRRRGKAK